MPAPRFALAQTLRDAVAAPALCTPLAGAPADTVGRVAFAPHFALAALPADAMAGFLAGEGGRLRLFAAGNNMADVLLTRAIAAVTLAGDAETRYAVSNDGGTTWFNWAGETWHKVAPGQGQPAAAMQAAGAAGWNDLCAGRLRFAWQGGGCDYIEITFEEEATP